MSEYSAKTLREKAKARARELANPGSYKKGQMTSSADWTPAEPLETTTKTGARPISPRAYKRGGAVKKASGGEIADAIVKRDTKKVIGSKDHVGGFKKGGKIKDAGVKDKKALGAADPSPKRGAAQHYKKGGRAKKEGGGWLENLGNALAGRGYVDGSTWLPKDSASDSEAIASNRRPRASGNTISPSQAKRELAMGRQNLRVARSRPDTLTSDEAARELAMGRQNLRVARSRPDTLTSDEAARELAMGRLNMGVKKGGSIKKAGGGGLPSPEEAIGSEERLKGIKAMPSKSSTPAAQVTPQQLRREESYSDADRRAGRKDGGRKGRATGGAAISLPGMKSMGKKVSRKGAKTDINIVINAGKPAAPHHAAMSRPAAGPAMPPPDMSAPPMGAAPPPPPMPGAGAGVDPMLAAGLPAPGRKAGGRVSKVAKSYKDMMAGSGSGEGRLQKTDIAKKDMGAPAKKRGGGIRGK